MKKPRKPSPDCRVGKNRQETQGHSPLGAQFGRKEELRAARNSRASRPSYQIADVAQPTPTAHPGSFLLRLVKGTWAAATGYMIEMGAPEE